MVGKKLLAAVLTAGLSACVGRIDPSGEAARPTRAAAAPPPGNFEGMILGRQAAMHMSATLLNKGMKAAITNGTDVREQVPGAEGMMNWAEAIPGMFPPGSIRPGSRAKAEIWLDKANFDRKAADYGQAARRLAEVARAGDYAGFSKQVEGLQATCAACHKLYRSD